MKKSSPAAPFEAQTLLAAIITSSDDAIVSKDLNGNITSWNPAAEIIFGYTAAEAVGRHISILIPPDKLPEEDYIIGQIRQGNRVHHFETMRRHKDGHLIPVSITVSPIRDDAGDVVGASKISRDISDRIRAEQALRESSQKKDDFLANMSHELRTPMNAVIGLASILKAMPDLPGHAVKYVDTLKTSADHLMDLINDLLDFAKIEAASFEIEHIEFDLIEQVEKVISIMNVRAQEKNLNLLVNYDPALNRYFIGDPLRIYQVLMNVLSNAIKFTEKGSVEADIRGLPGENADTTRVIIAIKDTGIGIAPEKLDIIFDKFTQADSSITRRYGGSGLGLAITKACTEKMGGTITVESHLGLGTVFTVTIPLQHSDKIKLIDRLPSSRSLPLHPGSQKNILLVEDYEPNILVAGSMLEQLGYNYDVAKNGMDAIRSFVHGRYDIILMDVQMNELDGLEATRRIRKIEAERKLARTPIVAMTAHVREQDQDKCREAGMDDFIPKPFELHTLGQKIGRYMERSQKISRLENAAFSQKIPDKA